MKKPLAIIVVASVAVVSVVRLRHAGEADLAANRLLANRIWIDHIPRSDKDTINVFALVSEQSAGAFQATSRWRGSFEAFRYEVNGADLRLVYPQTGEREAARAKARRCNEPGMQFCLEVEGASRGVKRYFSREGWEIGKDLEAAKRQVEQLRAQLAASE